MIHKETMTWRFRQTEWLLYHLYQDTLLSFFADHILDLLWRHRIQFLGSIKWWEIPSKVYVHSMLHPVLRMAFCITTREYCLSWKDWLQGIIRICHLPPEFTYDGKWSVRKVQQGKDVSHIEYFEQHGLYALATHTPEEFLLVDDEGQYKEVPEGASHHFPTNIRSPRIPTNNRNWSSCSS